MTNHLHALFLALEYAGCAADADIYCQSIGTTAATANAYGQRKAVR